MQWSEDMSTVLVSICCLTYNHVSYIKDALEGFVKQKTNFNYEIWIFDDASTDGTSEIIQEYKKAYPDIIKTYIAEQNTWMNKDRKEFFHRLEIENLQGKYIAYCEGDDYWTDENKLQIQVDYMENHPDCTMYIHNALWLDCETKRYTVGNPFRVNGETDVTIEELIMQKYGHPPTASFLYRRILLLKDVFFFRVSVGDYPLLLCAAAHGMVHYNNNVMSVYRWKSKGSYTQKASDDNNVCYYFFMEIIDFLIKYNRYTEYKFQKSIMHKISHYVDLLINRSKFMNISFKEWHVRCAEQGYCIPDASLIYDMDMDRYIEYESQTYLTNETYNFIKKYKHIIIMGTGYYAKIFTEQMQYYDLSFDGYTVSDKRNKSSYFNEKRVYQLNEIPFDLEQTGVIVAILIRDRDDILESLKKAKIINYYMPFEYGLSKYIVDKEE